jgi:hypothetical protein
VSGRAATLAHLARRFAGSLRPGGPSAPDEAWARSHLLAGEVALWERMSGADRRHSAGVARAVVAELGERATRPVVAAALLHDVGKVDAGLGTFARVGATVAGAVAGQGRRSRWDGRVGRYLAHDRIGARLLQEAGSDALTVAWAREHHLAPHRWTLDRRLADALKAADDD